MRRILPISLIGLVATGVVFVLQGIPAIGIFLMYTLAMFWSVVLINASMIGVRIKTWTASKIQAEALTIFDRAE